MPRIDILILAAGRSTRMGGRDKLLEPVRGRTLLEDRVTAARETGAAVTVALPPRPTAGARWDVLEGSGARLVAVDGAEEGMAASIRAGVAGLGGAPDGLIVMLADMPEVSTADLRLLMEGFDGATILRGASGNIPGNPVLFPARDLAALAGLSGDKGARDLLEKQKTRVRLVPLPGSHAIRDLDTPADWARWRGEGLS